jgi:ketosteroid isomerase-like protein
MQRTVALTSSLLALMALVNCSSPTTADQSQLRAGGAAVASTSRSVGEDHAAAHRAATAVGRLDSAEVQAFLANDPAMLARLWSDDFVVTNPFNQFLNKQQVLALVTSGTLAFSAYARHIGSIHAYGDVVVVAGSETVVWAGSIPLAGQTSQLRYTAVWSRHGNEWQEVARHASFIQPSRVAGPSSTP